MAIKHLIALCLVFAIVFVNATPEAVAEPEAEAEADADADAWYGYYRGYGGYGYGHRYGFGGYRPYGYGYHYQRRPYHYKPRPVLEVSTPPKIINRYGYRLLPEAPAPAPVVAPAPSPAPAPAFVRQEEPIVVTPEEPVQIELMKSSVLPLHPVIKDHQDHYAALGAVPAVPEDHFGALPYMAAPTLPPAVVPAPVAPAAPVATPTRAADIVPVFNNEIDAFAAVPEEEPAVPTDPKMKLAEKQAALQSILKMLKSFPAVPEDHLLNNNGV